MAGLSGVIDHPLFVPILLLLLCQFYGVSPPLNAKFGCNDERLDKVYAGKDTLNTKWLLLVCLGAPLLLYFLGHYSSASKFGNKSDKTSTTTRLSYAWTLALQEYRCYWIWSGINLIVNDVLKTVVARPRPHFYSTCQPKWHLMDCSSNNNDNNLIQFDLSLCHNSNSADAASQHPRKIYDAVKSFPSGHAQAGVFMATASTLYLYHKCSHLPILLRLILHLLLLYFCYLSTYTRILDNRHHLEDVMAGAAIGTSIAVTMFYRSPVFHNNDTTHQD